MYDIPVESKAMDIGKGRQGQGAITRLDLFAAAAYAACPRSLPECYEEARRRIAEYNVMTMECADGCWDASKALYRSAAGTSYSEGWEASPIGGCGGGKLFFELSNADQNEVRMQHPSLSQEDLAATMWSRKPTPEHRR